MSLKKHENMLTSSRNFTSLSASIASAVTTAVCPRGPWKTDILNCFQRSLTTEMTLEQMKSKTIMWIYPISTHSLDHSLKRNRLRATRKLLQQIHFPLSPCLWRQEAREQFSMVKMSMKLQHWAAAPGIPWASVHSTSLSQNPEAQNWLLSCTGWFKPCETHMSQKLLGAKHDHY